MQSKAPLALPSLLTLRQKNTRSSLPIVTQLPDAQSIHYSWLIYQANLPYVSTQDTKFEASKAYFARIIAGHSFCERIMPPCFIWKMMCSTWLRQYDKKMNILFLVDQLHGLNFIFNILAPLGVLFFLWPLLNGCSSKQESPKEENEDIILL